MATKKAKEQVMDKVLVDATGADIAPVSKAKNEDWARATGIKVVRDTESAILQTGGKAGEPITMFAIFGASTHATNDASTVRQSVKDANGDPTPDAEREIEAVSDFFEMVYGEGKWIDDSPRVGGVRANRDRTAAAIVDVFYASPKGKGVPESERPQRIAAVRAKLNDDDVLRTYLAIPEVDKRYAELTPRKLKQTDKSVEDLAALMS